MLHEADVDGFNDRQLVACPAEVHYRYHEYQVPIAPGVASFYDIFATIYKQHQPETKVKEYVFSTEAQELFAAFHDELVERKLEPQANDSQLGVLSEAP